MNIEEEERQEEEYQDDQMQAHEERAGIVPGYYPQDKEKESIFKFWRDIVKLKDSRKVGNLAKDELGRAFISVRGSYDLELFCNIIKMPILGGYFKDSAQNIVATSTSYKGMLLNLFATDIKKVQRIRPPPEKKGWFSKKEDPSTQRGGEEGV